MLKSFKYLSGFEKKLWVFSLIMVTLSFVLSSKFDILTLIASLTGVTALIFVSKGDVLGQWLTLIFSLIYAIISYRFNYYGEMITYMGMTAPIAALSIIAWVKNPYSEKQVRIKNITKTEALVLLVSGTAVTILFYFILKAFGTANLVISTVSVFTSFVASSLMLLRSPYYALAYGANDIVLIILWVLAAITDPSSTPMIICFLMFLFNDIYGYWNWLKIQKKQDKSTNI